MKELLAKRRNRTIALLLTFKEQEVDGYLPPEVQVALRKVILDQVNDLTEFALGLLESPETSWTVNELFLQKLNELQDDLDDLRKAVAG